MINSNSRNYWGKCLNEADGIFGKATTTGEAMNEDLNKIKLYVQKAFRKRRNTPYGDNYYEELEAINFEGKTVLDFGCGAGIESAYMQSRGAKVTAVDIVPSNVGFTARVLGGDGKAIILESYEDIDKLGKFDIIFSNSCLHHILPEDIDDVTIRLMDCIRPGGQMLALTYTKYFYPHENAHKEGPYSRGYSPEEFSSLFYKLIHKKSRVFMNDCFVWHWFEKAKAPKASVIVSTFRPGGIDITMAGMRDQTFKDFELILVDKRYSKRHKEVMEMATKYGIKCIHVPEHRINSHWNTFASAWNTAVAVSQGEVLLFLGDWMYAPPGWIEGHLRGHQVTQKRAVLSRYIYTAVPPIAWKKPIKNFDIHSQMYRGGICVADDMMLTDNVADEVALFAAGEFDASWIPYLKPSPPPDQDIRHQIMSHEGSVGDGWLHIKCESIKMSSLHELNAFDERLERGKGPLDTDFAARLQRSDHDLWWDPNIPACYGPNPRWYFRTMPWGSFNDRLKGRWSYNDGLAYIAQRCAEIDSTTDPALKKKKIRAKNKYDIKDLTRKLEDWRNEANHPVESTDIDDVTYWGCEMWPDTP